MEKDWVLGYEVGYYGIPLCLNSCIHIYTRKLGIGHWIKKSTLLNIYINKNLPLVASQSWGEERVVD